MLDLDLVQCCPPELATAGVAWADDIEQTIKRADVIITDGPGEHAVALAPYRITAGLLDTAPRGAQFIPCPPHIAGREATADAFAHPAFAGHSFKKRLLAVQQAIMDLCLT